MSWYSDAALERQAELARKQAAGEPPKATDLLGLLEPRVPPTAEERCVCCGLDARTEVFGEVHPTGRYCDLCISRGHHEE